MTTVGAEYREPSWFRILACFSPLMVLPVLSGTHRWSAMAVLGACLLTVILSAI
jgi:hypothetical protein